MSYKKHILNNIFIVVFISLHFGYLLHAETDEEINARLEQARENVRISQETERRILEKIDTLDESGEGEQKDKYQEYLSRLQAITKEHENALAEMEIAYSNYLAKATSNKKTHPLEKPDWQLPEEKEGPEDNLDALDRKLNESLADFDDFLLRENQNLKGELDRIARHSSERVKELNKELDEVEGNIETSETQPATPGKETPSERNSSTDDIVAKQLREAAEAETDPELKRRLWEEYDHYKEGIEN